MLSLLATILLSQCATGSTDNAQHTCGHKTFDDGVSVWGGLSLRGGAYISTVDTAPVLLRDSVPTAWSTPSFVLETSNYRYPWDVVLRINVANQTPGGPAQPALMVFANGNVYAGTLRTFGNSGTPSLLAPPGLYTTISADLPEHYNGEHGALSVSPGLYKCEGHNLLQASNNYSGTGARTDYAVNFDCNGGWYTRAIITSSTLPVCNGSEGTPPRPNSRDDGCTPDDGTTCWDWYKVWPAGLNYARAGTVLPWVDDVGEGCQCVPAKSDGGLSSSWRKLSDRTECRP